MNLTITGSLGNVSQRLTQQLVKKGHAVTLISHDPGKANAIQALKATPAIGSVEDVDFLTDVFIGADAVYTMVPPLYDTTNYRETVRTIAGKFAQAIEAAGVRYVVNLSSIGAHVPEGNGPSSSFYFQEKELYQVPHIHLLHLRAGMFYTNFYGNLEMIRHLKIMGNNFDGNIKIALSHPHDIADAAAEALDTLSFAGKEVRYVVSDEQTGTELARLMGDAMGQPDLPWIQFADEDLKQGALQSGFSDHMASLFVELGQSIQQGHLFTHYQQNPPAQLGQRKFADFVSEFAMAY